jgi:hypothetical protein
MDIGLFLVDHSKCPSCGHYIPIRPSSLLPPETDPRWKEKGDGSILFACSPCRRVYSVNKDELEQRPTAMGVGPYAPGTPMTVFRVPILCDELDCSPQLLVHVELKSNTNIEQLRKERLSWQWAGGDLKCPRGHDIPYPQREWTSF